MDPEPAMLAQARLATAERNVGWLFGADSDVGALTAAFGPGRLARGRSRRRCTGWTTTCGTDDASQERYARALEAAGYAVSSTVVEYSALLTADELAGGGFSAMSPEQLPAPAVRPAFTERIRTAVAPHGPLRERVRARLLTGIR
ncbi:hypothetical protein [Amycolatopsis mediterranei]|nr:hypothetical protein [Amycolatopsis mediterranei]UZF68677.1 hypothetical protein ISP_001768 [Amycolatopsis mediterranei]